MSLHDFTIYDLILRNARVFRDKEAWISGDRRMTFGEFRNEVDRLAAGLHAVGIRKGDRLGILAQNCIEYVLLYGAAAKIGAVMLPINWRLTPAEVEYILTDGKPKLLFVGEEHNVFAKEVAGKLAYVPVLYTFGAAEQGVREFSELLRVEGPLVEIELSRDDPYLIIHTAAVAGRPRGATLAQGNIIAANLHYLVALGMDERDSYIHLLPLFHIADVVLFFAVFQAGGKNVLMSRFDPGEAVRLIETERITTIGEFPPMLSMLLEKLEKINCDISSLKHVVGIDTPENIAKLKKRAGVEFLIGFGQSETTGMVTSCPYSEKPGSAGREAVLARVKVVDEYDREVPPGTPGEICVRGPLVFLGYWNLEEDTRYAFRGGWHHTGDIGRLDEDGYLWYLKRKAEKELIKPGGENVYPAEVEKAILEHGEVAEVAVIGVKDPEWGEAVKAVCALKAGSSVTAQQLIGFVGSRIARYKKPKYVQFVAALPKNQDGSIDRDHVRAEFGSNQAE